VIAFLAACVGICAALLAALAWASVSTLIGSRQPTPDEVGAIIGLGVVASQVGWVALWVYAEFFE
jgi:phosphate/sulfate permease